MIPEVNDVVFDCGAYVGDNSIEFAKSIGIGGKVYAFEPFEKNFTELKKILNCLKLRILLSQCSCVFPQKVENSILIVWMSCLMHRVYQIKVRYM